MSRKIINIENLSKEREDVFDIYYNKLEQLKIELINEKKQQGKKPNYDLVEKGLTIIERNLDDLASSELKDKNKVEIGNSTIVRFLKDWFDIFEQLGKRSYFIEDFTYNLLAGAAILSKIYELDNLKFRKLLKYISPTREDKENFVKLLNNSIPESISLGISYPEEEISVITEGNPEESITIAVTPASLESQNNEIDEEKNDIKVKADTTKIILIGHQGVGKTMLLNHWNSIKSSSALEVESFKDVLASAIKMRRENDCFRSLLYKKAETLEIEEYRSIINNSKILSEIELLRKTTEGTSFEWDILVKIDDDNKDFKANEIGFLMWSIAEALGKIEGVKVTLEDWGNGSKWFRFKTTIKDELAKEEVKQVLNKSKEALESQYLDKPIEETKKLKAEREKIEKESNMIIDGEDAKKIKKLQLEKMELENEQLRVTIMKEKLELIQGFSQLISQGIIKNDSNIQIMINDLMFIEKKEKELIIGEDIEIIEEAQIIHIPKLENPETTKKK